MGLDAVKFRTSPPQKSASVLCRERERASEVAQWNNSG